jgi:hypothetical protein
MGTHYVPKWTELASSLLVIAAAVMAFRYAVIYLDILPHGKAATAGTLDIEQRTGRTGVKLT